MDTIFLECSKSINKNIRSIRIKQNFSQKQVAEAIGVSTTQISYYEKNAIPPAEKLIKLSEKFNTSIQFIATGKKLYYDFINKSLLNVILKADSFLSMEDKGFIIKLRQRIIDDSDQEDS